MFLVLILVVIAFVLCRFTVKRFTFPRVLLQEQKNSPREEQQTTGRVAMRYSLL